MTKRTPSSLQTEKPYPSKDPPLLISACLLGVHCRYDARERGCQGLIKLVASAPIVPFCPEQLGGLPTPRPPANIVGGDGYDVLSGKARVISAQGSDVTNAYLRGAEQSLYLARLTGAARVLLKDKSPSCGLKTPYCENPAGPGVTAALFILNRLKIMEINSESDFPPPDFFQFFED